MELPFTDARETVGGLGLGPGNPEFCLEPPKGAAHAGHHQCVGGIQGIRQDELTRERMWKVSKVGGPEMSRLGDPTEETEKTQQ